METWAPGPPQDGDSPLMSHCSLGLGELYRLQAKEVTVIKPCLLEKKNIFID